MSIAPPTPLPLVVIGGGISGLACGYRLQQSGIPVRVLNAGEKPGGVIETREQQGFYFEVGPQSFLSTEPLLKLIEKLGLKNELLHADSKAPRYILLHGKLVPAPLVPPSLLKTPLLSTQTKYRIFTEMFRRTSPPEPDESIAAFIRRKFGPELLERLVAPFVSGIYAGDPEKLSLRASFPKLHEFELKYGSVLRGAMKLRPSKGTPRAGLCSFRDGMDTLPRALAARLGDELSNHVEVTAVRRGKANGKSSFEIDIARNDRGETLLASAVIVAAPTSSASEILKSVSEQLASSFARIEYAPVAVVAAGYRREQVGHKGDGFGFLVPRTEGLHVLGTVWNSSLFPGRAPEGMACFTSFAGGATDSSLLEWDDDRIADTICAEVGRVLNIAGPPVTRLVHRYAHAIPQYNLGHTEVISRLREAISSVPGLFLAGNYLSGPSIGSCVEQATQTAEAARVYLASIGVAGVGAVAHV